MALSFDAANRFANQVIEVLETADYNGEERVRCMQGWLSTRNANDRANIKPRKDDTP